MRARNKLCFFLLLASIFCTGCGRNASLREVEKLPYWEQVGTITQYKNFVRGGYQLSSQDTHILSMSWLENGSLEVYLEGENGYRDILAVESGAPLPFTVPETGLYQIRFPLDGVEVSELTFSLQYEEPT